MFLKVIEKLINTFFKGFTNNREGLKYESSSLFFPKDFIFNSLIYFTT